MIEYQERLLDGHLRQLGVEEWLVQTVMTMYERARTVAELRESMGIEKISDVMRCSRLRWMGHVLRKEGNDWVKKSMDMTVEGSRGRGRPKMTWEKVVERDMKVRGSVINDAKDGVKWRALSWGAKG